MSPQITKLLHACLLPIGQRLIELFRGMARRRAIASNPHITAYRRCDSKQNTSIKHNCKCVAFVRSFAICGLFGLTLTAHQPPNAAGQEPEFAFGINLNGPPVVIDGKAWEGEESTRYLCTDRAFDNQQVELIPATDPERARMIRSSRWGGNRVTLTGLEDGTFSIYLYVWEDNNPETYSISINNQVVASNYNSGQAGHWEKLGPWRVRPSAGRLVITSRGGAANFSGVEVWRGAIESASERLSEEQLAFFEKRIRPVLVEKCYSCHSSNAKEIHGQLLVDSRQAIRNGGATGPAVVPGKVEDSLLIKAIRYRETELQMPPDEPLSQSVVQDFEAWIASGAADPRTTPTQYSGRKIDWETARSFWSLKPVSVVPFPEEAEGLTCNPIDHFIREKIKQQGLSPSARAEKRALIRRASFDLIGLPPTPNQVDQFLNDPSPDAFAKLVDRLLESPEYGRRWGRYWLDVVRYADTAGDNSDFPIPQMRLYRDWVIDSFNRDLPYDQFVRLQLAGDLVPYRDMRERRENIIATGYIANSRRFGSRVDDYPQHLTIEDTLDNFGRAFLGLTINCARCHDHKFDPIGTDDYYGLYGVFSSTRYPWPGIELEQRQRDLVPMATIDEVNAFEQQKDARQKQLEDVVKALERQEKNATEGEKKTIAEQLKKARESAREHSQLEPPYELVYGVLDQSVCADAAVQLKGDPARPAALIRRRFLQVLGGQELPQEDATSGRLHLADWLFAPSNPLPARVMVNRIWQYHFGKGLVPTPNDFGRQGKPPTHPELLDWLAQEFVRSGWSIKSMHRLMMNSHTYQQSAHRDGHAIEVDPTNDWLSAFSRRRLDAEAIRDTLLWLSGELDHSVPGPHPFPPQNQWKFTQHNPFKAEYPTQHRSVYLMTQRIQRHPFLAIFDGADPSTSTATRSSTTTPLQALYFLNDQQVQLFAERFASRITADFHSDDDRISAFFEWALAREPSPQERAQARRFLADVQSHVGTRGDSNFGADAFAWQAFARVLFRLNEFVYVD